MFIYHIDAFTNRIFGGNPAAVCLLQSQVSEQLMQDLAMEMNLSETAFAYPENDGYCLRWFTPKVEVDLCGHATLATAHLIWQLNIVSIEQKIHFYTRSGLLTCTKNGDWIEMDFPAKCVTSVDAPAGLIEALGVIPLFIGSNKMDYLVEIESEEELRNLKPNISALSKIPIRGVIVTSKSQSIEYDFISRFFAPAVGVNEDPVTGSAHTALAPYWSNKLTKNTLTGYQASARGGLVKATLTHDRVLLGGQAITVLKSELIGYLS